MKNDFLNFYFTYNLYTAAVVDDRFIIYDKERETHLEL